MSADPAGCEWCPVCQAMARLRVSRPDLAEQLRTTSAALTSALAVLLRDLLPPEDQAAGPGDQPADPAPERPPPRPPVQPIDISE